MFYFKENNNKEEDVLTVNSVHTIYEKKNYLVSHDILCNLIREIGQCSFYFKETYHLRQVNLVCMVVKCSQHLNDLSCSLIYAFQSI